MKHAHQYPKLTASQALEGSAIHRLLTADPSLRELAASDIHTEAYSASTTGYTTTPSGVVQPTTEQQVAQLVRAAGKAGVSLYPISCGKNWGYGAANAPSDGQVIVDLSQMNRVVEFDAEAGLVTVEPGVSQRDLDEFLRRHDAPFLVPASGAGPLASILGNAMERGYGITPYADHFGALTSLRAILPDGSVYRPALSELGGEGVDRAFKWGLGPYVDGLFTQGGFGIVTQATFALAPKPEAIEAFFFSLVSEEALEPAVVAVRNILRQIGSNSGSINLMNRHRVLSMVEPYPRDQVARGKLMPEPLVEEMAARNQVMPWMGAGVLYGSKATVRMAKRIVARELKPLCKRMVFLNRTKIDLAKWFMNRAPGGWFGSMRGMVDAVDKALTNFSGSPSEVALPLTYWRSGRMPDDGRDMDPARDGCGLIWYAPLVECKPGLVREYVEGTRNLCVGHAIEPLITLTSLSDRCFDSTVPLLFDRGDEAECRRAQACYDALFDWGCERGFVPYRLPVNRMQHVARSSVTCWNLVKQIKQAIDPQGIIAPGRYCPVDKAA